MKYFLNATERKSQGGTCYFEFQKGKFKNKFWCKDSLYIHADMFDSLGLGSLFSDSIENFCYYGPNKVSLGQWSDLVKKCGNNKCWKSLIEELTPWAEDCFNKHKCFHILGI